MSAPAPGSPEWMRFVTASKVAAILSISPFESQVSVWLAMRGEYRKEQTDVMRRGHYLEGGILAWWRDQHPDATDVIEQQWTERAGWMAATPDLCAVLDGIPIVVDAKSAAYDDDWDNDEGGTSIDGVPLYYWVQSQWQMIVTGARRAFVAVLGPRLKFVEYVIEYDDAEAERLIQACRSFYDSLAADERPELDGHSATFAAIKAIHPSIDKGAEAEIPEADAVELVEAIAAGKGAAEREQRARAVVLDAMGAANFAMCNGIKIARRQGTKSVSFVPVAKDTSFTEPKEAA